MKCAAIVFLAYIAFLVACFAAWVTHIIVCIKTGALLFLIVGALIFPVAVIHGAGCWFHVW